MADYDPMNNTAAPALQGRNAAFQPLSSNAVNFARTAQRRGPMGAMGGLPPGLTGYPNAGGPSTSPMGAEPGAGMANPALFGGANGAGLGSLGSGGFGGSDVSQGGGAQGAFPGPVAAQSLMDEERAPGLDTQVQQAAGGGAFDTPGQRPGIGTIGRAGIAPSYGGGAPFGRMGVSGAAPVFGGQRAGGFGNARSSVR